MVYQYATVINVARAGSGRESRRNYMYITAYIHNEFKSSHDVSNVSCLNSFLTVSSHPVNAAENSHCSGQVSVIEVCSEHVSHQNHSL